MTEKEYISLKTQSQICDSVDILKSICLSYINIKDAKNITKAIKLLVKTTLDLDKKIKIT